MRNKYYIVAINYDHYTNWLHSSRPKELIGEELHLAQFSYVDSVDRLRGLTDIKGFYLPGCESRPDYNKIKSAITIIKLKPVTFKWQSANTGAISGSNISGIIMDELTDYCTADLGDLEPIMVVDDKTGRKPPGTPGTDW